MSLFERLFSLADLSLVVPDTSLEFPPKRPAAEWLEQLNSGQSERKQAFFDEQLHSLLLVKIDHPAQDEPVDHDHPPADLLSLLAHVQVSLEATYISSTPNSQPEFRTTRLSAPPRTASLTAKSKPHLGAHPSIYPPNTPNPAPSSTDHDRRYANAEGTLLSATQWGQNISDDIHERFALLWSPDERVWVAIYQLGLTVSFLRLNAPDPLLCLTVSVTLREKPLGLSGSHPFTQYLKAIGNQIISTEPSSPAKPDGNHNNEEVGELLDGLEELNLLEGLHAGGPTFGAQNTAHVSLPTTRIGTISRKKLFSLSPASRPAPAPAPAPASSTPSPQSASATQPHATLRKSFRKTLGTVSGFRVRMRTVFVPYVLLAEVEGVNVNSNEADDERERLEAGSDERTVVLCVEVENSGESGEGVGFAVERVEVSIGGEGARATLISWGDGFGSKGADKKQFPIYVGTRAQYNLLYAVSFLRSPDDVDGFSLTRDPNTGERYIGSVNTDLQRAVTINIFGKPYHQSAEGEVSSLKNASLSFPTRTFSSRWNCVLDLSAHHNQNITLLDDDHPTARHPSVLPEPASPFPAGTPKPFSVTSPGASSPLGVSIPVPQITAIAGSKRHTMPGLGTVANRAVKPSNTSYRASTSMLNPANAVARERERDFGQPSATARSSYMPPSVAIQPPRSPTTYGPPPSLAAMVEAMESPKNAPPEYMPPPTPAYPAYPQQYTVPPTPAGQGPISTHAYPNVGPSVEIRRERGHGFGPEGALSPRTPGPSLPGGFGEPSAMNQLKSAEDSGESVVVSVGLLPPSYFALTRGSTKSKLGPNNINGDLTSSVNGVEKGRISDRIYPMDYFALDIFVFNQSMWPRRFEITCPDRRKRRKKGGVDVGRAYGTPVAAGIGGNEVKKVDYPGILPLDYRIRIGPLRPAACQSVRMQFLAISPGVHAVETLTLTDIESGYSTNLRSVMDVVVHDPMLRS
ncbi:hypothetical protein BDN72DRAFT_814997 [Pluteus cervinus]|uniref:Uncharacterized protein n=1 Tax=Pluteus cervinus TaxID=181527 RepID=A0ACD3B848_9AGAR|nr:hypothetical protein BDN72DRAFT_814997 [Pluteus cervinus]